MYYLVLTLLITFASYKLFKFRFKIFCFIYQFNRDEISELLELVLSCILSKLTMKDVVKIGIQSRRWVNIWLLRTDLNFDVPNMFHSICLNLATFNLCLETTKIEKALIWQWNVKHTTVKNWSTRCSNSCLILVKMFNTSLSNGGFPWFLLFPNTNGK